MSGRVKDALDGGGREEEGRDREATKTVTDRHGK